MDDDMQACGKPREGVRTPLLSIADLEAAGQKFIYGNAEEPESNEAAAYDSFKVISSKALANYKHAEKLFLDFLASADVWSQEEVPLLLSVLLGQLNSPQCGNSDAPVVYTITSLYELSVRLSFWAAELQVELFIDQECRCAD
jgi:hypothetical protein